MYYERLCVCIALWTRFGYSWFKETLQCWHVHVSERCGQLMPGNNHENSVWDTLKSTTESQYAIYIQIYGLTSEKCLKKLICQLPPRLNVEIIEQTGAKMAH